MPRGDRENISMSRTLKSEIRTMIFIAGALEYIPTALKPYSLIFQYHRPKAGIWEGCPPLRYSQGRNGGAVILSKYEEGIGATGYLSTSTWSTSFFLYSSLSYQLQPGLLLNIWSYTSHIWSIYATQNWALASFKALANLWAWQSNISWKTGSEPRAGFWEMSNEKANWYHYVASEPQILAWA